MGIAALGTLQPFGDLGTTHTFTLSSRFNTAIKSENAGKSPTKPADTGDRPAQPEPATDKDSDRQILEIPIEPQPQATPYLPNP